MALPTGTISLSQVNVELGLSSTATISLNDADVRNLAGVASGAISMDDLRGKSAVELEIIQWQSVHDTTGRTDGLNIVELNFGQNTSTTEDRVIDWGDGTVEVRNEALPSHTYSASGEYTVKMGGGVTERLGERGVTFEEGWRRTLKSVIQWDVPFTSFQYAFYGVESSFTVPGSIPSTVTNLFGTFDGAIAFNQNISSWDISNVNTIYGMFNGAIAFNQPIGNWNTTNVTDMRVVFNNARAFNQPIGNWNTANVTSMVFMFNDATAFNQDIGNWNTANVTSMSFMFTRATVFNQDLTGWCVTNITSEPTSFATDSALNPANYPVWGTCP